jgi:hypothetical protein
MKTGLSKLSDRLTFFERAVVFRVARGYFVAMAVVAVVLFAAGLVAGAKGLVKSEVPRPAALAAPKERQPLTYAEVLDEARRHAQHGAPQTVVGTSAPSGKPSTKDAETALETASRALRAVFPDPPYAWTDEVEKVCTAPTAFGCLQTGTRVKRQGVVSVINDHLQEVEGDELVDYVNMLTRILAQAPVEKRLELVPSVIAAEVRARSEQKRLEKAHEVARLEQDAKYKEAVETNDARIRELRLYAFYGVGTGFGLLIVVSLFLAFLSMERHTRVLEQLVSHSQARGTPVSGVERAS